MADNSRLPNLLRKMVIDKISRLNNNLASADEDVEKDTVVSLPPSLKRGREGAVADTPTTHIVVINKCKEANGATPGFESSAIKKQKTCEKEEGGFFYDFNRVFKFVVVLLLIKCFFWCRTFLKSFFVYSFVFRK